MKKKKKKEKKKTGHMINNGEFLIPEPPGAKAEKLFYLVNRKPLVNMQGGVGGGGESHPLKRGKNRQRGFCH